MKKTLFWGRLLLISLFSLLGLAATGCRGLSDLQLSGILEATVATGLQTLAAAVVSAITGVPLETV